MFSTFTNPLLKFSSPKRFFCTDVQTPYFEIPVLKEGDKGCVFTHTFSTFKFDNNDSGSLSEAYRKGSSVYYQIELWLAHNSNLVHVPGNKSHDLECPETYTKYQVKCAGRELDFSQEKLGGRKLNSELKSRMTDQQRLELEQANKKAFEDYCKLHFIIADLLQ